MKRLNALLFSVFFVVSTQSGYEVRKDTVTLGDVPIGRFDHEEIAKDLAESFNDAHKRREDDLQANPEHQINRPDDTGKDPR
jgi:hypothetical protein